MKISVPHHPWRNWTLSVFAFACVTLAAGCSATALDGHAASMLYDPDRVSGLPAVGGPNGVRYNAPHAVGQVEATDSGDSDRVALLAVNDIEQFWTENYSASLDGRFVPASTLISYDSTDASSPDLCGDTTYQAENAFYCPVDRSIAWDRGSLIPNARKYYGDIAVAGVLAHEYGHAIQEEAGLDPPPGIVAEQQADCFAGVYLRWVAEGHSTRFTMNTTDGLDHVLAGALWLRDDPVDGFADPRQAHGSALDRITAFQEGFDSGAAICATIDRAEIKRRQAGLPRGFDYDSMTSAQPGEMPINSDNLATLMELLGQIFHPANPPTLTVGTAACPDAKPTPPASYCPATNTISVDLAGLQRMGAFADEESQLSPLQGDNTAFSVLTSRYMLALQHQRGVPITGDTASLRTACLTGVAQRHMSEPVALPSGRAMVLSAGDLDEAVSGLLVTPLAAGDVNGSAAPAGFTRIFAFRSGLMGDDEQCYRRFA
jgi:predicted metalloprotease